MLSPASAPSRTEKYYHKHPDEAFAEGFVGQGKMRRHGDHYYRRSHFFLPAKASGIIKFLKKYFSALDGEQNNVPNKYRYRQAKWEFAETAISIFDDIRRHISLGQQLVGGSDYFCGVPWVIVGPTMDRLCRHNFSGGVRDIFDHYAPFMQQGGFNCVSIDRPKHISEGTDKLRFLHNIYHTSTNFILTCAILFLFDLVIHGGPDCVDFRSAFTNDSRIGIGEDIAAWTIARQAVLGSDDKDIDVFTGQTGWLYNRKSGVRQRYHNLPQPHYRNNGHSFATYWEVTAKDVEIESGDILLSGEKVREYRSIKSRPAIRPYLITPQSDMPEEEEDIEEPMNPYQNWQGGEITGMEYGAAIAEMYHL